MLHLHYTLVKIKMKIFSPIKLRDHLTSHYGLQEKYPTCLYTEFSLKYGYRGFHYLSRCPYKVKRKAVSENTKYFHVIESLLSYLTISPQHKYSFPLNNSIHSCPLHCLLGFLDVVFNVCCEHLNMKDKLTTK